MHVNSERIKLERKKKAWSQEHLAEASGLGLRTIQRIETSNSASFESVKSISATLGIALSEIIVDRSQVTLLRKMDVGRRTVVGVFCTALLGLGAIVFGTQSFADQIMLDIGITLNDESEEEGSLLTKDGKDAEMRMDEIVRFVVVPTIQEDGRVLLTTKVYEYQNGDYVLIGEPKLLIKNNNEAEIRMTMNSGDQVRFQVTPHAD